MLKDKISTRTVKQFLSYFVVGGLAALVEWAVFTLLEVLFDTPYLLATALAFVFSTTANWLLGRTLTFRHSAFEHQKLRELILVFAVSGVGLLFNLLLMYLFVTVLGMNTNLLKTLAKIAATGIVFLWNFLSRKLLIYKV